MGYGLTICADSEHEHVEYSYMISYLPYGFSFGNAVNAVNVQLQ